MQINFASKPEPFKGIRGEETWAGGVMENGAQKNLSSGFKPLLYASTSGKTLGTETRSLLPPLLVGRMVQLRGRGKL